MGVFVTESRRVGSFGAGVQTTALAILNARGLVEGPALEWVFADTGGEHPETYEYLERWFRPWAEANGVELRVVSSRHGTLYDYAMARRMVPSINTAVGSVRTRRSPAGGGCGSSIPNWPRRRSSWSTTPGSGTRGTCWWAAGSRIGANTAAITRSATGPMG